MEDNNELVKYRSYSISLATISKSEINCNYYTCTVIVVSLHEPSRAMFKVRWRKELLRQRSSFDNKFKKKCSSKMKAYEFWHDYKSFFFIVLCLNFYLNIIKSNSLINISNSICWEIDNVDSNKTCKIQWCDLYKNHKIKLYNSAYKRSLFFICCRNNNNDSL